MVDPVTIGIAVSAAYVLKPAAEDFFKRIAGPLADEIGAAAADSVRAWRASRAAQAVEGAHEQLTAARINPEPIPPKLLITLLEAASLEDDDLLTARWSALLANAAAGTYGARVHPRFVSVLQELTPLDAEILEWFQTNCSQNYRGILQDNPFTSPTEFTSAIGALISLGLLRVESDIRQEENVVRFIGPDDRHIYLTSFGGDFLEAVSAPESSVS